MSTSTQRFGLVAALSVGAFLAVLWAFGLIGPELTYHGPYTNLLKPDQEVIIVGDGFVDQDGHSVKVGTRGVVKVEPAWDDDSCSPRRSIVVVITAGDQEGKTVKVHRNQLRKR